MFLYFFPTPNVSQSQIDAANLRYALPPNQWHYRQIVLGPGQTSGTLVARSNVPFDRTKFDAAHQSWRRIPRQNVYCGKWNDATITPDHLARPSQCSGLPIALGDDHVWLVAFARKFIEHDQQAFFICPLPHDLDLADDGNWTPSRVAAEYRTLAELADEYWQAQTEAINSSGDKPIVQFEFPRVDEFAIAAITANYYVSGVELALLNAYNVAARRAIIDATLDVAFTASIVQKKTDAARAGSDLTPGPDSISEENSPATLQPLAS